MKRNSTGTGPTLKAVTSEGSTNIVDFDQVRSQKLEEKRRKTERILFQNLLGVFCQVEDTHIKELQMVDVSEEGCSFLVPFDTKNPWPANSSEFPVRLYFTQDTYLLIHVKVANSRPCIENGRRYVRYGCAVDQSVASYEAYRQFVRFMKSYSEQARKDSGKDSVFYI
jgi:hypothetical protein